MTATLTACSNGATLSPAIASAPSQGSASAQWVPTREPPPESLMIVPAATRNLRLLEQAAQTLGLCQALAQIHDLPQPKPDDAPSQLAYAYAYSNVLGLVDPSSKIPDPYSRQENASIPIPAAVLQVLDLARRSMYAYWVRIGFAQSLKKGPHGINSATLNGLLRAYFVELVNSHHTAADRALVSVNRLYCHQGS